MHTTSIKRALLAVFDKTGIAEFAKTLVDEFGIEILSTGGTAKHLRDAGIAVTMVEQVTGFPEMLDGRVKTLHPKVHAGILADRSNPEHQRQLNAAGIEPIDMIVVSLYPFQRTIADPSCTFEQAIEMIDIGGPCMLRAAAKNHTGVVVICDSADRAMVLQHLRASGEVPAVTRRALAAKVFATTSAYDAAVAEYLSGGIQKALPEKLHLHLDSHATTRYGENPHQQARVYVGGSHSSNEASLLGTLGKTVQIAGDPMSFNNYVDGDSALSLIKELTRARLRSYAVAFIKHTNACGCAIGDDAGDVYRRAYLGDPIAAAGGVLCMNFPVTRAIAEVVMNSFARWGRDAGAAFFKLDVWIAPSFDADAVSFITTPTEKRKWGATCRLLAVGAMNTPPDANAVDFRSITGGFLAQNRNLLGLEESNWKVVTHRQPTDAEMADLRFAWLICKHTKSNAITLCKEGTLLGSGAGQMSRVKSCDLAIQLTRENGHGEKLPGAVAAGDAFFPVPDGPGKLIDAGITAIIHPGGSNRDADTLAVCDAAHVAMMITGQRHFKH